MFKRIVTGAVLAAVLIPALIFYDSPITPALWVVIVSVSLYEMAKCVGIRGTSGSGAVLFACIVGAALPVMQYVIGWGSEVDISIVPTLLSAAFVAVFILYAAGVFGAIKSKLSPRSEFSLMLIYVAAAAVCAVALTQSAHGGFLLPIVFICSWITDSFAFFCGSFFGKHKLIPKISPKKTVEGSIGGTVACMLVTVLYAFIVSSVTGLGVNYIAVTLSGLFLSVISQIGDLNASYIKREHGIKDYGTLFPGHGGMLDRFDSVIAVTPFLYILSCFFTYFY